MTEDTRTGDKLYTVRLGAMSVEVVAMNDPAARQAARDIYKQKYGSYGVPVARIQHSEDLSADRAKP